MKSFSTTLNRGGTASNIDTNASTTAAQSFKNSLQSSIKDALSKATTGRGLDTDGLEYNLYPSKKEFLTDDKMNIINSKIETPIWFKQTDPNATYENANYMGSGVYDVINKYRGYFKEAFTEVTPIMKEGEKGLTPSKYFTSRMAGSPSLFNPYYAVNALGITDNIPLLDSTKNGTSFSIKDTKGGGNIDIPINNIRYEDTTDCSIRRLVEESSKIGGGILGQARYKYSDFMYCQDLGKIANNHLLTLRRFAYPVTDDIYSDYHKDPTQYEPINEQAGDVGRLIAWFGDGVNNLEEIMHYNYSASWREINAAIETQETKELEDERGILGVLSVLSNKENINLLERGDLDAKLSLKPPFISMSLTSVGNDPATIGALYDKNKVYEPQNTIRKTNIYEGELNFTQEFSLTFRYKLRAYDNINPKSAFLDLLGNIQAVTYRNGSFWEGEQRILGPKVSKSDWNNISKTVDEIFDSAGNVIEQLWSVSGDVMTIGSYIVQRAAANINSSALDSIKNASDSELLNDAISKLQKKLETSSEADKAKVNEALTALGASGKNIASSVGNLAQTTASGVINTVKSVSNNFSLNTVKNMLKNKLGRAARYSFQSLLKGDPVGLWHLTIGNPLNPIASIGNLIMTNATVTHSGPLGFDDFPTELKVVVTLKHGRPRDAIDIQKMYTKGKTAVYIPIPSSQYYASDAISNIKSISGSDNISTSSDAPGQVINNSANYMNTASTVDSNTGKFIDWFGDWCEERIETNRNELR